MPIEYVADGSNASGVADRKLPRSPEQSQLPGNDQIAEPYIQWDDDESSFEGNRYNRLNASKFARLQRKAWFWVSVGLAVALVATAIILIAVFGFSKSDTTSPNITSTVPTTVSTTTAPPRPRDCEEIKTRYPAATTGFYTIYPKSVQDATGGEYVSAYCNMDYDGGGWTTFQRRVNGDVNFTKTWNDYKLGFGDSTNFWLGNEWIRRITAPIALAPSYNLLVEMTARNGTRFRAYFNSFFIDSEIANYQLSVGNFVCGNATDGGFATYHNNMDFSTFDRDTNTCAVNFGDGGGWWFNNCHYSFLNGKYATSGEDGLHWYRVGKLLSSAMMLRRKPLSSC